MSSIEKIPNVSDILDSLKNQQSSDSKEILPPTEEAIEPLTEEEIDPCEADIAKQWLEEPPEEEEIAPLIQTSTSDSRFSAYGQVVINQAKADGRLVEFASKMPPPKRREKMLKPNTRVNNTDTWSKYVFREANDINDWQLGSEWTRFSGEMTSFRKEKGKKKQDRSSTDPANQLQFKLKKYESLIYKQKPLSNADFEEGMEILRWLKLNHHIDESTYNLGITELR